MAPLTKEQSNKVKKGMEGLSSAEKKVKEDATTTQPSIRQNY